MIIVGLALLIAGFLLKIAILWTLGIIVLVIGLVLMLLGGMGRAVGGRRYYCAHASCWAHDGRSSRRRAPLPSGPGVVRTSRPIRLSTIGLACQRLSASRV